MEDRHTEELLKLLKSWQTVVNQESEVISRGDIQNLEKLIQLSSLIQQRVARHFSSSGPKNQDTSTTKLIMDLHTQQGKIIETLREQTESLAQEIGTLRKNKTSLMGYKQNRAMPPRFKNERM